jgi:hypothetical protein
MRKEEERISENLQSSSSFISKPPSTLYTIDGILSLSDEMSVYEEKKVTKMKHFLYLIKFLEKKRQLLT